MLNANIFKNRSFEKELLDGVDFSPLELEKNLREFKWINRWLGSSRALKNALEKVLQKYCRGGPLCPPSPVLTIADLGCGAGDLAREIACWAQKKEISYQVTAIDINPDIIQFAKTQSFQNLALSISRNKDTNMQYKVADIFSEDFKKQTFDIVCLNNVCHHFNDEELNLLFQNLRKQAKVAIIINDLHRCRLAYYGIVILSRVFNLSRLAKNDGPLSVLKAFKRHELLQLISKSSLDGKEKLDCTYSCSWKWAFRWQAIIWCGNYKR